MTYPPPYPSGPSGPPPWAPSDQGTTYGPGPTPWSYGAVPWEPPPGLWTVPPARRPWSRQKIALVVGGVVLGVAAMVALILGAIDLGAQAVASAPLAAVDTAPPSDPTGLGTDPGLNGYAQRCHDGQLSACDDLYDMSQPMSDYEQYGMTCGGRVKAFDVEWCTDLSGD